MTAILSTHCAKQQARRTQTKQGTTGSSLLTCLEQEPLRRYPGGLFACDTFAQFPQSVSQSNYFFAGAIVSFATLATRNFTTVLALILIVSPVCGLRPSRALRSAFTSLPIPGIVNSPFFLVSFTAVSASNSRPAAACLLVISSFSAMWRTSAVFVIPFAMCVAPSYFRNRFSGLFALPA